MERTFTTPVPPTLQIRVPSGEIVVNEGAAGTTKIELDDAKDTDRVRISERSDAEGPVIVIEIEGRRRWGVVMEKGLGRIKVTCPPQSSLVVRTASASLKAMLPLRQARVESASGDLRLSTVEETLVAKTASGDVEVKTVGGPAEVYTVSGDIRLGPAHHDVCARTASGDVDLAEVAAGDVNVRTVSGDITVAVRPGSRVAVDASSVSGSLRSDLDLSDPPVAGDGPLVELGLTSVSGDVHVRRSRITPN